MAILKSLIVNGVARIIGDLTAAKIIKQGGISSLFLKADGSVDSTSYYHSGNKPSLSDLGAAAINHTHPYLPYSSTTVADANLLTYGLTLIKTNPTNAAHTNHSAFLYLNDCGTPFLILIPDSSVMYIYKRYYSGGTWSDWSKMSAGYADSAGNAAGLSLLSKDLNSSPGTWVSGGSSIIVNGNDYIVFLASAGYDTFLLTADANTLYFRQNDSTNIPSNGWNSWVACLNSSNWSSYINYSTLGTLPSHTHSYLPLSGGTMTGTINCVSNYYVQDDRSGINMNNSDIVGCNSIRFGDLSDSFTEALMFYRSNGNWDSFRASDGTFYFGVNNGTEYTAIHSGNIGSQSVNYANYAGVASKILDPDYHDFSHRRTSANINFSDGALHYYLATSSMSTGKPSYDAHILHMSWDNGSWEGQLSLPTSGDGEMQWRSMNGGTWASWHTILDSNNYKSYCAAASHSHSYLPLNGGTMSGSIILKGETSNNMTYGGNVHPYIRFDNSDSSQNVSLIFTDYDAYRSPAGIKLVGNQGEEWFEAYNIYANTFYGNLSGKATTAGKADSAGTSNYVTVNTSTYNSIYNILFHSGNGIYSSPNLKMNPSSGNVTSSGHFYANSDIRYKNIIEYYYSLSDKIAQLPIIKYKWTDRDDDSIRIGSSALSVMSIIPELVSYDTNTDFYSLDYATLGAIAGISACREVETLKLRIQDLEQEIIFLKSKYNG